MAVPLLGQGGSGNGNGRLRGRRYKPMSEINVTPFVDVMLVLLIVFMVTAPLLTVGVPLDLPKANAPAISQKEEPVVVSINAEGRIYVQEQEVALDNMAQRLSGIRGIKADTAIFVRGDQKIQYGRVMEVMSQLSTAGFSKVKLVSLPAGGDRPAAKRR